jgi:TnpA family transposase
MEDKKRFHSHFSLLLFSFHYTRCCKNISHPLVAGYKRITGNWKRWNPRKRYYATALRIGTADADAILRRFTRSNVQHPTYQALGELGRVIKTLFLCEYLSDRRLRQEIQEALNVIEQWNSVNGFIFHGKGGELLSNRPEDQEIAVLSLHLIQVSLALVLSRDFDGIGKKAIHTDTASSAISSMAAARSSANFSVRCKDW